MRSPSGWPNRAAAASAALSSVALRGQNTLPFHRTPHEQADPRVRAVRRDQAPGVARVQRLHGRRLARALVRRRGRGRPAQGRHAAREAARRQRARRDHRRLRAGSPAQAHLHAGQHAAGRAAGRRADRRGRAVRPEARPHRRARAGRRRAGRPRVGRVLRLAAQRLDVLAARAEALDRVRPAAGRGRMRCAAWLAALVAAAAPAAADELRALVGGMLVDGTGGPPLADSVILIDGERITAVGQIGTISIPATAEVISTEGMTVLPGLWDLQVHLTRLGHTDGARWDETYLPLAERVVMPAAALQLLLSGVTSVRDVASPLEAAVSVRERVRAVRIPGPTLYVSGPALAKDPPPGARDYRLAVGNAADARQKAERIARAGVDYLLVAGPAEFSEAELAAIATAAREVGVPWYAEVHHDADIAVALGAGASGLLGLGTDVSEALPPAALSALSQSAARDKPVGWSVGASALTNYDWLLKNAEPLDDPRWRDGLPPIIADDVRGSLRRLPSITAYETPTLRRAALGARLHAARAAGARLLVGSDAGLPAQLGSRATWQEIEELVLEGGLTSLEAIHAATLGAATELHAEHENGSVSPGKYADIIAVRGDALRHVERLQDVEVVLRHGRRYR